MTARDISAEIARHEDRIIEIKSNLLDADERRGTLARELEEERLTISTLEAVRAAMEQEERQAAEVPKAPARRRQGTSEGE